MPIVIRSGRLFWNYSTIDLIIEPETGGKHTRVKARWGSLHLDTVGGLRNFWSLVSARASQVLWTTCHVLKDWQRTVEVFALDVIGSPQLD